MSKNNAQEYVRKMEPQRQRFGLRKLSVGVASVLLGTTFMVGGTVAHANTDSTPAPTAAESVSTNVVSQNDAQSQAAISSQTSGSQVEMVTNRNKNVIKTNDVQLQNLNTPIVTSLSATINLNWTNENGEPENLPSITYEGKTGDTLQDVGKYIQGLITTDNSKYEVSPLVSTPKDTGDYLSGNTADSITDPSMKLAYDDWRKNKEKNYPFAGYTVEIDSLSNAPLTNGGTYTINLGNETRLYNEPYWVITSRTIHYVKYGLTGSDSVASPDVIQEGYSNVTNSKNNPVVKNFNLEKDGHHYVSYETVQRSYNVASGIPDGMTDKPNYY